MLDRVKVSPSVLAADFTQLHAELDRVGDADYIHFDVMDGHFVPNHSFGPHILMAVKRSTDALLDVHLMVTNPDDVIDWYVDAGADIVSVHLEAADDLPAIINRLHERGALAGVVINPPTPVQELESVIDLVDIVLIMSVNPGFGGQSFIEGTYDKVRELRRMCERHGVDPLLACAVIECESGWDEGAVSPVGAVGLMQVMPDTARSLVALGLVDDGAYDPDDLADPATNIEYGCAYLGYLQKHLSGLEEVIAAYNAGIGAVQGWISEGGTIPEDVEYAETRAYLDRVLVAYDAYQDSYPSGITGT